MFLTRLLRPVQKPLEGQVLTEPQLVGLRVGGETEYRVEEIRDEKKGRGGTTRYLVK
jgi:hypothetical protein